MTVKTAIMAALAAITLGLAACAEKPMMHDSGMMMKKDDAMMMDQRAAKDVMYND